MLDVFHMCSVFKVCVCCKCSFLSVNNITLCAYKHFIYLFIRWWEFGLFLMVAIMKNDVINICVCILRQHEASVFLKAHIGFVFNIWENDKSGCTTLQTQGWVWALSFLVCQHWFFFLFNFHPPPLKYTAQQHEQHSPVPLQNSSILPNWNSTSNKAPSCLAPDDSHSVFFADLTLLGTSRDCGQPWGRPLLLSASYPLYTAECENLLCLTATMNGKSMDNGIQTCMLGSLFLALWG